MISFGPHVDAHLSAGVFRKIFGYYSHIVKKISHSETKPYILAEKSGICKITLIDIILYIA